MPRDRNTQLVKSLFKLNLAYLYSSNFILRDLLVNYFCDVMLTFFSCSAHISWVCCYSFLILIVLSLTFFSVLSLLLSKAWQPILCKGPSYTSVKVFFSVSTQPQLLEVESPGDVSILNQTLLHLVFFFVLFFSLLSFIWLLYSCENWIELNYFPLPLHLNTKPKLVCTYLP
jgi:hypothetical protein